MTRWVTTTQPTATLTRDTEQPPTHADGTTVEYFHTAFGKRFARIIEKCGLTYWMREIESS